MTFPAYFVSHGAPTLAIEPSAARDFLSEFGKTLGHPAAIAVISAHWETPEVRISTANPPRTIHDFGGFPDALYQIHYASPGAPDVAAHAARLLSAAGIPASLDPVRGLDHGAWVPLRLLRPQADIPVFQISVQPHLSPAHAAHVGEALAPLRDDGVILLASGSLTHNLRALDWDATDHADPRAVAFADWVDAAIAADDRAALLDYRARAPHAAFHHPTEEHLLPLFAALGASSGAGKRIHTSATFGNLMMDAYEFH